MESIKKILGWYFTKKSLPYWSILTLDCLIIVFSTVLSFWLFHGGQDVLTHFTALMRSVPIYLLFSVVSFRIFHTYTGIIRYSSFVDLERVGYANLLAMAICIVVRYPLDEAPEGLLAVLSVKEVITAYAIATIQMWGVRILVKSLYDVTTTDKQAMRAFKTVPSVWPKTYVHRSLLAFGSADLLPTSKGMDITVYWARKYTTRSKTYGRSSCVVASKQCWCLP